jgi:hypothetical protein
MTGKPAPREGGGRHRLAWFAGLYLTSLGIFTVIVYGLRALVGP